VNQSGRARDLGVSIADTKESRTTNAIPTAEYRSLVSQFFLRFCVAVTLCVIFLIVGELISYRHGLPQAQGMMDPLVNKNASAEQGRWIQWDAAHRYTYHPYILWRHRPFQGSMINVSEDGVRRTSHIQCDEPSFTIWMFGDSSMWGTGATDDETIPSYLASDYDREGRRVCVVNYGEAGWENTQEVIELMEQLKHGPHKPNVVIFYDGGTEAFNAYQAHQADTPTNYNSFEKYLDNWSTQQMPGFFYLQMTNTYRLLDKEAGKLSRGHKSEKSSPMTDDEVEALAGSIMQNYQQNMDIVALLAQHYGFRAIFMWYPVVMVGHKPLTPNEKDAEEQLEQNFPGVTRLYRAAYFHCEETHPENLYYLGDLFDNQKGWLFSGVSHLKPEGNRIVAEHLFRILEHPAQLKNKKNSDSSNLSDRRNSAAEATPEKAGGDRIVPVERECFSYHWRVAQPCREIFPKF